ncbi:transglutaminaseTgpA domain-containing protein [Janibacter sp. GS2]|uniref:transglutaminaseTgpA domain-containing protein n=1 Tax=Janibacter sp. GS2 TaxID=3442646 RepID=UPI003EBA908C
MSLIGAPRPGMIKPQPTGREKVRATLARLRPTRAVWVDAGFSLAVMVCLLSGLRTVMFGWQWWLAAAVGLVLGFFVGHIQSTYRWPLVATVALGGVLYLVLGGPLVVRDDLRWGLLPTGQTMRDLIAGPVTGWMDLLTLIPPVDARGRVLAIALALSLVGTVLVYATARATRSRWRLLLTPFALLVVIIALGTDQPAARWVQGLVLGLVLAGWLAARDHLDPEVGQLRPGGGRPALSRVLSGTALLAVAALAGVLVGPVVPGSAQDRQVARTGIVPGHDDTVLASPLSTFREFTRTSPRAWYDTQILQVDGVPGRTPLRLATLDAWDGSTWGIAGRGSARSDAGRSFQQFGRRVGVLAGGSPSEVSVTVPEGGYSGPWVLTTGRVEGIEFRAESAGRLQDEAWLNLSTNTVLAPPGLQPGDRYTLRTRLPPLGAQNLPEDLAVARGSVAVRGDEGFLESRIADWRGATDDPWESFVAVATAMREEGTYTDGAPATRSRMVTDKERTGFTDDVLRYPAGHGRGRLDTFLNSSPLAGNDEQYAATLALIGNRLGIPTRVVVGAISTDDGKVRGRDIRAWVEVKQADGTWFQVLPQTFNPGPDGRTAPSTAPVEWQAPPTEPIPEPPAPGPTAPEPAVDWSSPSTWPLWAQLLAVFVGVPLLLLALTPVAIAVRRATRLRRGGADRRIGRAWNDFVEEARVLGHHLPASGTRVEQGAALGPTIDAVPVAMRADSLVFGERPPDPAGVSAWQRELRAARRRMRRSAGIGSRLRAAVDPRPLFSRQVDIGLHDSTTAPSRKALR